MTAAGFAKSQQSPLRLATFERATETLFNAAGTCADCTISGVAEALMVGNPPSNIGSSIVTIVDSRPVPTSPSRVLIFS
ncbi:hypothetical protein ACM66B_005948 [Microbotryomycetes sp. NB124-2]